MSPWNRGGPDLHRDAAAAAAACEVTPETIKREYEWVALDLKVRELKLKLKRILDEAMKAHEKGEGVDPGVIVGVMQTRPVWDEQQRKFVWTGPRGEEKQ
jgi:hypothetical protein